MPESKNKRIWINKKLPISPEDFLLQPLDVTIADTIGDVIRRHLVCRVNPNLFNDACYATRIEGGLSTADEDNSAKYRIDKNTKLPVICTVCPAIPVAIREQITALLAE